jgi:predicted membrane metal-binding protein
MSLPGWDNRCIFCREATREKEKMTHLAIGTFWVAIVLLIRSCLSKDVHFLLAVGLIAPLTHVVVNSLRIMPWYASCGWLLLAFANVYPRVGSVFPQSLKDAGYEVVYRSGATGRAPSLLANDDQRVQVVTPAAVAGASGWRCSGNVLEFFGQLCRTHEAFRSGVRTSRWVDRLLASARKRLRFEPISEMPVMQRRWTEALLFGAAATLPEAQKGKFKRLGLYHLLVMSGQHFTIVIVALGWVLSFPVRLLYVIRCCSYPLMVANKLAIQVLLILGVWVYFGISDSSPAILRAALASTVMLVNPYLLGVGSGSKRILLVLILYLACSPSTLYTLSAGFSFFAYTVVVCRGDLRSWPSAIVTQLQLAAPGLMWFGQISLLGALVALPMMSAFNWVMIATLVAWALAGLGFLNMPWLSAVPSWYHGLVNWLVGINDALNAIMHRWLELDDRVVSLVCMAAMGFALLSAIGRRSARISQR